MVHTSTMYDPKQPVSCILVIKDRSLGYWEINHEVKKGYFRDHGMLPPEDLNILDFTATYANIEEFLKAEAKIPYVKTIIPDRKIIFGNSPFCSWSHQKTSEDGIVSTVFCQHPALVTVGSGDNQKMFCGEHANFDVPKMTSTSSVSS